MNPAIPNPRAASKRRASVTLRRLHKFIYTMNVMSRPDEAIAAREAGFGLAELGAAERFRSAFGGVTLRVWSGIDCLGSDWLIESRGVYSILLNPCGLPEGFTSEGKEKR